MKWERYSVPLCIIFILIQATALSQIFEDFESGEKGTYAGGAVSLASGSWYFHDALIGDDDRDRKHGSQSARIRDGYVAMNFNAPEGASFVSFYHANAGFLNDTGGKVQLQYSTDNGSTWTNTGDEFVCDNQLREAFIYVGIDGDVRFRIVKTAGGRVNVDDVFISEYMGSPDEPFLSVYLKYERLSNDDHIVFPVTAVGSSNKINLTLLNNGSETLSISDIVVDGDAFSVSEPEKSALPEGERTAVTVTFSPLARELHEGSVTIQTNSAEYPSFTVHVSGDTFFEMDIMPIIEAREMEFGTRVTVTGWVTVANEFDGPIFFQDETAGLAAFYRPLHTAVEIGDSVVITGPITEFRPGTFGTPGTFLRQISAYGDDDDIRFEVFPEGRRDIAPAVITLAEMNGGGYEGQLVRIDDVEINHTGVFQGHVNYGIRDATGFGEIRIDNSTNIVGATVPEGAVSIVGVVDRFNAVYQLKPRFTDDLDIEVTDVPGDDIAIDDTFDVTTWNIEWFGSATNGPGNVTLQLQNVKQIIDSTRSDLYALQEISNDEVFAQLLDELEDYDGFIANYTQTQRTAYLYNIHTIDLIQTGLISYNQSSYDWAGRFPLFFRFNVTINDQSKEIIAVNIHAKAGSDPTSYQRRVNASQQLKDYLDSSFPGRKILFLGDYNDDVTVSIYQGLESPYSNFVEDPVYTVITKSLSEQGYTSFRTLSMIDHITATDKLATYYIEGTERVENPYYIGSYLSTTSDHFPVSVRFSFDPAVSVDGVPAEVPEEYLLRQNYPNPFNYGTSIRYEIPFDSYVSITVYNILGQEVRSLVNERQVPGEYTVYFDASGIPSGLYFYRMSAAGDPDGTGSSHRFVQTRRMLYVR